VGHRNYRHFLLFVLYLLAGCGFVLATASLPTYFPIPLDDNQRRNYHRRFNYMGAFPTVPGSASFFQIVLAFSASIALSLFAAWHVYLTLSGQTTLEFYINAADRRGARQAGVAWVNPFDHGAALNFEQVLIWPFCSFKWLLPTARPPPGNGMDWQLMNGWVSAV
jgi:palmitoyltransferase